MSPANTPVEIKVDVRELLDVLQHRYLDIVLDGPPSDLTGAFVEVESPAGTGIKVGTWIDRGDGFWALRLTLADFLLPSSSEKPPADIRSKYACPHCGIRTIPMHLVNPFSYYCPRCGKESGAREWLKRAESNLIPEARSEPAEKCVYCGASYLAHEIDAGNGLRAHRIDHPGRPQHGQVHFYLPNTPEVHKIVFD